MCPKYSSLNLQKFQNLQKKVDGKKLILVPYSGTNLDQKVRNEKYFLFFIEQPLSSWRIFKFTQLQLKRPRL